MCTKASKYLAQKKKAGRLICAHLTKRCLLACYFQTLIHPSESIQIGKTSQWTCKTWSPARSWIRTSSPVVTDSKGCFAHSVCGRLMLQRRTSLGGRCEHRTAQPEARLALTVRSLAECRLYVTVRSKCCEWGPTFSKSSTRNRHF